MWVLGVKYFIFLQKGQQEDREPSGHPVATFPKDARPQEWQWKPGSKPPLQFFLVVLKYKHFLTFPSPAHEPHPHLAGYKPMSSCLVFPSELFTRCLQIRYKLV